MTRIAALLVALVLAGPSLATGEEPEEGGSTWVSRSKTLAGLAEELASLHQRLYDAGTLPSIRIENADGTAQEVLMLEQGKYYGAYVPQKMQRISCLINNSCKIVESEDPGKSPFRWSNQAGDPVVLPNLDLETNVRWLLHAKQADEDMAKIVEQIYGGCKVYDDACREMIAQYNPEGVDVLDPSFEGLVWLPGLQIRTLLDLSAHPELEQQLQHNLIPNTKVREPAAISDPVYLPLLDAPEPHSESREEDTRIQWSAPRWLAEADFTAESAAATTEPADTGSSITSAVGDAHALPLPGTVGITVEVAPSCSGFFLVDSHGDESAFLVPSPGNAVSPPELMSLPAAEPMISAPLLDTPPDILPEHLAMLEYEHQLQIFYAEQRKIFRSISYPDDFQDGAFVPLVAVIDSRLDATHCGFDPTRLFAFDSQGQPITGEVSNDPCGQASSADAVKDHGTHVSGIIAARPHPQDGVHTLRGLNPRARVEAYELPSEGEGNLEVTSKIVSLSVRNKPDVLNLSFRYPPSPGNFDPVEDVLEMVRNRTLIVAAAGNDGAEHSGACPFYPACMDLPNILVVAATSGEPGLPELWEDDANNRSDFGRRVHIAAPGAAVPSTVRGNREGRLSGTSQAAPIVAGAASMIFSLRSDLAPYQVRNRLIYTSDFAASLEGKLLGGQLNIARALDLDHEVVTLREDTTMSCGDGGETTLAAPTTLHGEIISIGNHVRGGLKWRKPGAADQGWTELDHLRRLIYHPARRDYTLVILPRGEGTELENFRADLVSRTNLVEMRVEEGLPLPTVCVFELQAVGEYVAAFPPETP